MVRLRHGIDQMHRRCSRGATSPHAHLDPPSRQSQSCRYVITWQSRVQQRAMQAQRGGGSQAQEWQVKCQVTIIAANQRMAALGAWAGRARAVQAPCGACRPVAQWVRPASLGGAWPLADVHSLLFGVLLGGLLLGLVALRWSQGRRGQGRAGLQAHAGMGGEHALSKGGRAHGGGRRRTAAAKLPTPRGGARQEEA